MKIIRLILFLLMAAILILASLGAGKTLKEGLEEEEIIQSGRRSSYLYVKERDPSGYWITVAYTGVVCAGFALGGVWLAARAFLPGKKR